MSIFDSPVAGFDLETTAPNPEDARIVTACVGNVPRPGVWEPQGWLVNPGVPIPEEASKVHGIYDEEVQEKGQPVAEALWPIIGALDAVWSAGGAVIGANICYDFTVLDRESRRHLGVPFEVGGPVLDTLVLDKMVDRYRRGSRRLVDTARHYGVTLVDAHAADADALAAVRIAWALLNRGFVAHIPDGFNIPLAEVGAQELHELQAEAYAEQRTSFFEYLARKGEQPDDTNTVWPLKPFPEFLPSEPVTQ